MSEIETPVASCSGGVTQTKRYATYGHVVEIHSNSSAVLAICDAYLADVGSLKMELGELHLQILARETEARSRHHYDGVDSRVTIIEEGASSGLAWHGQRQALLSVSLAEEADPHLIGKTLLEQLLMTLVLTEPETWSIHASGLVAPDGTGVAICGARQRGKSTLAHALALEGWSLVSDDLLVHSPTLGRTGFVGSAQTISASHEAQALLRTEFTNWFYGPYADGRRGRLTNSHVLVDEFMEHLDLIILPQVGADRSQIREIPSDQHVDLDFKVFPHKPPDEMDSISSAIDAALADVDIIALDVDTKPRGCAELLGEYLAAARQ